MFLLVLCLSAIFSSHGDWDYSASGIARITTIGSQIDGTAGYGQPIWGDTSSVWYGYVRPSASLRASTSPSGIVNLDLYPLSFFGFSAGRSYMYRYVDQPEINCNTSECKGWLNYSYLQTKVLGKYQKFFGTLTFEKSFYDTNDSEARPVFHTNNVVLIAPKGETGEDWFGIAGYDINEAWSAGIIFEVFNTDKSNNHQDMQLAFVKWIRNDEWNYTVGVGRFESTPYGTGPQLTLNAVWVGKKKIGF